MNAPKKMQQETEQGPIFDPFPKPQTMPSGWDLSGFESASSQPTVSKSSFDAES